ncbi:MAG TPA: hypothetical protein ENG95_04345 [Nitrospirae bacterium]|nr:hypothetical protein [Nitrospirota bacterium]
MLIKLGVSIRNIKRPIRRTLSPIAKVFKKYGEEAVITSTVEGNHSASSLHYEGLAVDIRLPVNNLQAIMKDLRLELNGDYDIILEASHFHVEYDPH